MKKIYFLTLSFLALSALTPNHAMMQRMNVEGAQAQPQNFFEALNAVGRIDFSRSPLFLDEANLGRNFNRSTIALLFEALSHACGQNLYFGPGRVAPTIGDDSDTEANADGLLNTFVNTLAGAIYFFETPPISTENARFSNFALRSDPLNPSELGEIAEGNYTVTRGSISAFFIELWAQAQQKRISITPLYDDQIVISVRNTPPKRSAEVLEDMFQTKRGRRN